ncbi:MAG: hypothetical protein LBF71_06080 [Campylobacteraceae bacterium]|jgi:hypothetical protein|nr:hypothetical protein [Campylobacteraceae bacterium]
MKPGMPAGIIACILAVLGILFLGFVFVPIALVVAIIGTVLALKAKDGASIGVNILALILVFIGFATSPVLLALIGINAIHQASSSRDDARAISIKTDINAVIQSVPAWYAGMQEISIVNAMTLDTSLWKQNGNKAEYIYCDDEKTSGVNCAGGKVILKIVLLTPAESSGSNAVNIALNKEAADETNGIVTPAATGINDPWIVVDVDAKKSGIVRTLDINDYAFSIKKGKRVSWQ